MTLVETKTENRNEGKRTVHLDQVHVTVHYQRIRWSRGDAWLHLLRHPPEEVDITTPRFENNPKSTNPWQRRHTETTWGWYAPRKSP